MNQYYGPVNNGTVNNGNVINGTLQEYNGAINNGTVSMQQFDGPVNYGNVNNQQNNFNGGYVQGDLHQQQINGGLLQGNLQQNLVLQDNRAISSISTSNSLTLIGGHGPPAAGGAGEGCVQHRPYYESLRRPVTRSQVAKGRQELEHRLLLEDRAGSVPAQDAHDSPQLQLCAPVSGTSQQTDRQKRIRDRAEDTLVTIPLRSKRMKATPSRGGQVSNTGVSKKKRH